MMIVKHSNKNGKMSRTSISAVIYVLYNINAEAMAYYHYCLVYLKLCSD